MLPHAKTVLRTTVAGGLIAGAIGCSAAAVDRQQTLLVARSVLPAVTFRARFAPVRSIFHSRRACDGRWTTAFRGPAIGTVPARPAGPGILEHGAGGRGHVVGARRQRLLERAATRPTSNWSSIGSIRAGTIPAVRRCSTPSSCAILTGASPGRSSAIPKNGNPLPDFSFNVLPRAAAGLRRSAGSEPDPHRLRPRPGIVRTRARRHVLGRR